MSHSHEHSHDHSTYYMEQLCTIAVCGLLGIVAVLAYYLKYLDSTDPPMLARYLHRYVLWSGFAILGLVALRGALLWLSVGRRAGDHLHDPDEECCHDHDHNHGQHHDHDHHHHEHEHHDDHAIAARPLSSDVLSAPSPDPDMAEEALSCGPSHHHDHGHEHGWNPWRYIVLCLPIMLFFLGLPNEGFNAKAMEIQDSDRTVSEKSGDVIHLNFKELEGWAYDENKRESFEGRSGELTGQFVKGNSPNVFGLVRFKMTCCAADAIKLNVAIVSPESVADIKPMSWVKVTGQIQFRKRKDRDEYIPVLKLRSRQDVVPTERDEDPYL